MKLSYSTQCDFAIIYCQRKADRSYNSFSTAWDSYSSLCVRNSVLITMQRGMILPVFTKWGYGGTCRVIDPPPLTTCVSGVVRWYVVAIYRTDRYSTAFTTCVWVDRFRHCSFISSRRAVHVSSAANVGCRVHQLRRENQGRPAL